jgi:hypothetical protein
MNGLEDSRLEEVKAYEVNLQSFFSHAKYMLAYWLGLW